MTRRGGQIHQERTWEEWDRINKEMIEFAEKEVRAAVFEEAAKIAEKWHPGCPEGEWTIARKEIVALIRRAAQEKGKR